MTHKSLKLFLFRKRLLPALEHLHHRALPDAAVREGGEDKLIARFAELVEEAARHRFFGRDWYLHGEPIGHAATPPTMRIARRDKLSYRELVAYVHDLSHACSWSVIPWGVPSTGQMMALVSSDETVFNTADSWLIGLANRDLVVSSYTSEELEREQFRGAIFCRSGDYRGQGLWKHGRGSSDSALVLNYCSPEKRGKLPSNCELVCEANGYQFQPIVRRWVRVRDEAALLHFVQNDPAVIVTASGLDERLMWLALQDFAEVAEHVNRDPLHFGMKALETVSWIYIPMSDDGKREIYLNNDPAVTTRFTHSDEMMRAPNFAHQFFL
jgi:hypothetical protein